MRRRIVIALFFMLPLLVQAQSDSLKAAYRQVCTTLKEYKFESEDAGYGETKSITLKIQQGNFVFTFVDVAKEYSRPERPGTKTIKVPVNEATFYKPYYYDHIYIRGYVGNESTGVELIYKGKKELLEKYEIRGKDLSLRKLHKELIRLKEILLSEEYTGSLGNEGETVKRSTPKVKPTQEQKPQSNNQTRQRKRIPAGN